MKVFDCKETMVEARDDHIGLYFREVSELDLIKIVCIGDSVLIMKRKLFFLLFFSIYWHLVIVLFTNDAAVLLTSMPKTLQPSS